MVELGTGFKIAAGVFFIVICAIVFYFGYWKNRNESTSAADGGALAAGAGTQGYTTTTGAPNTTAAATTTGAPTGPCTYSEPRADDRNNHRYRPDNSTHTTKLIRGATYKSKREAETACTSNPECGVVYQFEWDGLNMSDGFRYEPHTYYLFKKGSNFEDKGRGADKAYPFFNQRNDGGACAS